MPTFPLPDSQAIRVDPAKLKGCTAALLRNAGLPEADALLAADVLVTADLRGVDTHGVSNMLRWYLQLYREGIMNPLPAWKITRETPATANIDSDHGLGLVIAPKAMEIAISKALQVGVGMVTMHNGHHLGMAQYHALLAVPHNMIGICLTASGPLMVPTFGREPRLGTNPIAIAVPCNLEPPFVYDAATTVVPGNKILNAHRLGMALPPGLMAGEDGIPIMQSMLAPAVYSRLLPLGSTPELASHKGYGLACMVEILTNVLGGVTFGAKLGPNSHNHFVAAISISAFVDLEDFKRTMDEFVCMLRTTPPAPGHERVLVPGQLEWEAEQNRRSNGIPLHPEVLDWLKKTSEEFGVSCNLENTEIA
jgi:LDH2 family malate/lactate/ureidoglycolate dehydrogenase